MLTSLQKQLEQSTLGFRSDGYQGITVAVSGGSDSVSLLHMLLSVSCLPLQIWHGNFCLRGEESELDAAWVKKLAQKHALPCRVYKVTEEEQHARCNTQHWARNIRLRELQRQAKNNIIALAHHKDDLAENIIYRLCRGTSVEHLLGMQNYHPPFWRPLLEVNKARLLAYCQKHALEYRTDASNADLCYRRNLIRHAILPKVTEVNVQAVDKLIAAGEDMRELVTQIQADLQERYAVYIKNRTLPVSLLKILPSSQAKMLLHMLLPRSPRDSVLIIYRHALAGKNFQWRINKTQVLTVEGKNIKISLWSGVKKARYKQFRHLLQHKRHLATLEAEAVAEMYDGASIYADTHASYTISGSGGPQATAG